MIPNGNHPWRSSPQTACSDGICLSTASGAGVKCPTGTKTTLMAAYHVLGTCRSKQ